VKTSQLPAINNSGTKKLRHEASLELRPLHHPLVRKVQTAKLRPPASAAPTQRANLLLPSHSLWKL
jgi:hypothetical protein